MGRPRRRSTLPWISPPTRRSRAWWGPCTRSATGDGPSTTRSTQDGSGPRRSCSIRGRTERHMPRPGFVLEVDERTPPLLVHQGEGFRMHRFPLGTRVVYPPDSLPPIRNVTGTIREALLDPLDSEPLPELLKPGMRLTIAFDDLSLPLPPLQHLHGTLTLRAARPGHADGAAAAAAAEGVHDRDHAEQRDLPQAFRLHEQARVGMVGGRSGRDARREEGQRTRSRQAQAGGLREDRVAVRRHRRARRRDRSRTREDARERAPA